METRKNKFAEFLKEHSALIIACSASVTIAVVAILINKKYETYAPTIMTPPDMPQELWDALEEAAKNVDDYIATHQ